MTRVGSRYLRLIVSLPLVVAASGCVQGTATRDAASPHPSSATTASLPEMVAIGPDSPVAFVRYEGPHPWRQWPGFWVSRHGIARKRVGLPRWIQIGQPTVSPVGGNVVFVDAQIYGDGAEGVVVARLARGDFRVLLRGVNLNSSPVWSPDGRLLTFSAWTNQPGGPCLFVLDVASGKLTRLIPPHRRVRYSAPVWSSDGKTILFSQRHTGSIGWRTELIDVHTKQVRPLPSGRGQPYLYGLTWQPHGQLIAAQNGPTSSAPVVLTTSTSTRLTALPLRGAPLGWSADGRFLLIRQQYQAPKPQSGAAALGFVTPHCSRLYTYDAQTHVVTPIVCAGPAAWEPSVDRVLYMPIPKTGLIADSTPVTLWSVTAAGTDRHIITRNAAYSALPALTQAPDS